MGILETVYGYLADQYLLLLGAIFGAAGSLGIAAYFLLSRPKSAGQRLEKLVDGTFQEPGQALALLEEEAKGLSAAVSKAVYTMVSGDGEELKVKANRIKLIQAGIRSRQAYRSYIAAKFILALLLPFGFFYYSSMYSLTLLNLAISCATALAGFLLPEIYVAHRREQRQERIIKGLPDALDLMVICVTAGLGLDMTFKRVGKELHSVWKELSEEFFLTNLEVRAGLPRNECYRNMAWRTGVPEVQSLMTMLVQTSRFGTNVSEALRAHSDEIRIRRRQLAEERASKTAVKIMIPLVLFILPALFIVLVGPAAIRVAQTLLPALGGK